MRIGPLVIFKEKPGIISPGPCWVAFYHEHMYIHDTLIELLWLMLKEWKNDRHLIG